MVLYIDANNLIIHRNMLKVASALYSHKQKEMMIDCLIP
jgi:hypothetical protein